MSKLGLVAKFAALSAQRLERLQNLVVRLEHGDDRGAHGRDAQRELHTLKGEARILGLDRTARLAHLLEDLLHAALAEEPMGHDTARRLLLGLDYLGDAIAGIARGGEPEMDLAVIARELGVGDGIEPEPSSRRLDAAPVSTRGAEPARAARSLALGSAELDELTRLLGELRVVHGRYRGVTSMLRTLSDRLGERSSSNDAEAARRGPSNEELRRLAHESLSSARAQLFDHESLLERLDHFAWSLRVIPVDPQLLRHPRALRDLAVTLGKKVRLHIEEHGARVERPVLEVLDDIALHLLRNAVDHGIGTPEERALAGKNEVGRITLAVRSVGAHVEMTVEDDGRGIDLEGLRRTAVANRILSAEAAAAATDTDMTELLFAPGFTTRREVSETSGRGVGLDAVRDRARSIGGTITVSSRLGLGTVFRALLPARVTMTRALVALSAGAHVALPAQSVSSVLALERSAVEVAAGALFVRVSGEPLPLVDLARAMGEISEGPLPVPLPVVIASGRFGNRAFVVDRVLGARDAVQVPPGPLLEEHAFVRSIALLEDGDIALAIDIDALPAARIPAARLSKGGESIAPPRSVRASILVVDDSEVTRDVISEALRDAGFEVSEAVDGRQALERIAEAPPALLITDLQMPVMDGFALMRAVRDDARWRDMPMIVVSTLGSEADRTQAARAGADAYIVKSDLRREVLRDVVARFVRPPNRGGT